MDKTRDYIFVSIQLLLFALYAWQPLDGAFQLTRMFRLAGGIIALGGLALMVWPILQLNRNLTMLPTPVKDATLITKGAFTYIRHPIYTGVFLLALGYGVLTADTYRLMLAGALLVLFYFKSNYEEKRLAERFPDYAQYKQHTKKFFPFIL